MSDSFVPDFASIGQAPPAWSAKRPVRIALLGDFGAGAGRGRLETGAALGKRKPLKVEFDTLEDAMRRLKLELTLPLGQDGAPVAIELEDLDAFHPDQIYANVPVFAELASLRKRLNNTAQFNAAAAEVSAWAENAGPRASSLARRAASRGSAPARGATLEDFARLTGRASAARSEDDVGSLLQRVVGPFVQAAASPKKDDLVAAVDAGLSDAMRALLQHPDFQTAESLWRGADFLLRRLETGPSLQVHLIDVSAEEFAADLSGVSDLSECGLYKLLVETPSQDADGGYAYVAACYGFEATPPHAELLGRAAQVASHAGATLLTGVATDPFTDRREPPHRLVIEAFEALRALPAASFLGLIGPRFLLRHPYGKKSDPISAFAFEEFSREAGLRGMLWGHPALLALTVLARGGVSLAVDDLPFHHYIDEDGDSAALPCTDRLVSAQAAAMLRGYGINAVMAHKGEPLVRFNGLEAINGDGLSAGGAAPKQAVGGARFSMRPSLEPAPDKLKKGEKPVVLAEPALRRATAAPLASAPQAADESEAEAEEIETDTSDLGATESASDDAVETAEAAADADADADATEGGTSGSSDESSAPDEAPAADDELMALLAGLDDPAKPADGTEEEEMDPELAALLKSLG